MCSPSSFPSAASLPFFKLSSPSIIAQPLLYALYYYIIICLSCSRYSTESTLKRTSVTSSTTCPSPLKDWEFLSLFQTRFVKWNESTMWCHLKGCLQEFKPEWDLCLTKDTLIRHGRFFALILNFPVSEINFYHNKPHVWHLYYSLFEIRHLVKKFLLIISNRVFFCFSFVFGGVKVLPTIDVF